MAIGQHEPVAIGPDRVLWIESHDAIPQCVDQWRERHRGARVAGLSALYRIDRKCTYRIDAELNDVCGNLVLSEIRSAHPRLLVAPGRRPSPAAGDVALPG